MNASVNPDQGTPVPLDLSTFKDAIAELVAVEVAKSQPAPAPNPLAQLFAPNIRTVERAPENTFGGLIHCMAVAKNQRGIAVAYAKEKWGADNNPVLKALTTSGEGSDFVETSVATDVIEALRATSVVRASGAQVIALSNPLQLPRTAGASGSWVGEVSVSNSVTPATDNVTLSAKKAMVKVPTSRELIMDSSPNALQAVTDDVLAEMAVLTDAAYIRGAGTSTVPLGILNAVAAGQIVASTGNTADQVEADLTACMERVMGANVPITPQTGVWYMSSRSFNFLRKLRDGNGALIYPELNGATPMLYNYRVFVTNNIPNTLTVSGASPTGDETEIYFGRAPSLMIGDALTLGVEVLENVAYTDDGGTLVSGVDLDTVLVKAITRTDIVLRHQVAFSVVNGVQYGVAPSA